MYTIKHFTKEEMMKYEMIQNAYKDDWTKTLV